MNYQQKLNYYRELYSFHEYQQIMKLIYSIDTYVNNILEMDLGHDMEDTLIFAFIDQNEVAIKEAIGRLTLFGQNAKDDYNNEPKERFYEIIEDEDDDDDFACGCCDRWVEHVCIGPNRFYVEGFGIIDSNGKLVEEDDVPYTDDDEVDLRDDFADDEEEGFADDEDEEEDEEDDERDLYLLRKLIRGIHAILRELEL